MQQQDNAQIKKLGINLNLVGKQNIIRNILRRNDLNKKVNTPLDKKQSDPG